jgi:hypothetical protein
MKTSADSLLAGMLSRTSNDAASFERVSVRGSLRMRVTRRSENCKKNVNSRDGGKREIRLIEVEVAKEGKEKVLRSGM